MSTKGCGTSTTETEHRNAWEIFNLFPQSTFLITDDRSVATPDSAGEFDTTPDDDVIHDSSNNATPLQDVISRLKKCIEKSGDTIINQMQSQLSTSQNEKEKAEEEA